MRLGEAPPAYDDPKGTENCSRAKWRAPHHEVGDPNLHTHAIVPDVDFRREVTLGFH